jgi:hypothetical protein
LLRARGAALTQEEADKYKNRHTLDD